MKNKKRSAFHAVIEEIKPKSEINKEKNKYC